MRILILGAAGMLGHKLCRLYRHRFDTWATVRGGAAELAHRDILDRQHLIEGVDASNFDGIVRAVADTHPDVVINCIGIIKQLRQAKDPITSLTINSLFPHRLAALCQASGARLIHISTDCVFSGRKGAYTESDPSDAEDLYGRTKFLGEVSVTGCLTMRTSIIGREIKTSNGLIEWFLGNRGGTVRGFRRALYTGFTTDALAGVIAEVVERHPDLSGQYNVSSDPISKFDLLQLTNRVYSLGIAIEPDDDFICDRSLDSSRFRQATGFHPPAWPDMIQEMFTDSTFYDTWRTK
jgi:dTDP-4-dehydrorhamnose reductase